MPNPQPTNPQSTNSQFTNNQSPDPPPGHRSGFVALVGKPNVGKSTLLNCLLGQKIAPVSPRPQTTRTRLRGILTLRRDRGDPADAQIVFVDTPGIHQPRHKLGQLMVETASIAVPDADVVLFVADLETPPSDEDEAIAQLVSRRARGPVVLALNKVDLLSPREAAARADEYLRLLQPAVWLAVSATEGDNVPELLAAVVAHLPQGPRYYPEDEVSDAYLRDIAADLIREQAMTLLHHELPHAVAVIVEQFKERSASLTYVEATLIVERDSQKAIVIGQGGRTIKQISQAARQELERLVETQVYLDLRVKVVKNWRQDENQLRRLGYRSSKKRR
jgi:GTP-binding protein Era